MIYFLLTHLVSLVIGYSILNYSHSLPKTTLGTFSFSYLFGISVWGTLAYLLDIKFTPTQASLITTCLFSTFFFYIMGKALWQRMERGGGRKRLVGYFLADEKNWQVTFYQLPAAKKLLASFFHLPKSSRPTFFFRLLFPVVCATGLVLLWQVASRIVFYTPEGGLAVGHASNFGDIAIHLHLATFFLNDPVLPPEAPFFAGVALRYPFLVDYILGLTSLWGDIVLHALIQSFILFICVFCAVYSLTLHLFNSRVAAVIAPVLIFAWEPGVEAVLMQGGSLFTGKITGVESLSIFYAHLITQRGYVMGLPFMFGIFEVLHRCIFQNNYILTFWHTRVIPAPDRRRGQAPAGIHTNCAIGVDPRLRGDDKRGLKRQVMTLAVASGLLFVVYPMCFIWLMLACIPFVYLLKKHVVAYAILTGIVAMSAGYILYPTLFGYQREAFESFFKPHLLWMAPHDVGGALSFWLQNLGLLGIVSLGVGLKLHWRFTAGALIAFVLTNFFQFSPWIWDNTKILTYTQICMCILFCGLLAHLIHNKRWLWMCLALLLWTGDYVRGVWRAYTLTTAQTYEVMSPDTVSLSISLKQPDNHVLLYPPTHQHPCILNGCVLYEGYPGHIFSQGYKNWHKREQDAKELLTKSNSPWIWIDRSRLTDILRYHGVM